MAAKKQPDHKPWHPYPWTNAEIYAIKALASGTATAGQQKLALDWLVRAAGTYDVTYQPESVRDSDFAQGKRWVGQQLVKLVNMPTNLIKGSPHE